MADGEPGFVLERNTTPLSNAPNQIPLSKKLNHMGSSKGQQEATIEHQREHQRERVCGATADSPRSWTRTSWRPLCSAQNVPYQVRQDCLDNVCLLQEQGLSFYNGSARTNLLRPVVFEGRKKLARPWVEASRRTVSGEHSGKCFA